MKNIAVLLLLACLSGCFGKAPEKTGLEGKPLPSFNLLLMDSTTKFNTGNIPEGEPVVLFFFTPACPFCRALTQEIISNMPALSNVRFYFVTTFPLQQVKDYYTHYQLNKYSNITVGRDYESYFGHYFNPPGVPYMAVYAKDKRLQQVYIGKVSADKIKDIALQ